ncbi:hypothetical protein [Pleionea sp. CnH1-48]|uniref:hypothetical protein n=1 Tax=Pleionea sp. CnH1-48 TaxID=2954494 RepID=UPI00209859A1|nr:hypothetical protein [Pleionea sp. CnH1-48]MCO7225110.1 hypothetical protein [Pleionea sp. CnH1-48]
MKSIILCLLTIMTAQIWGDESKLSALTGTYHLKQPERSPAGQTSQLAIEYGQLNGKKVLVTKACNQCPPAVYSYQEEPSNTLGFPVFFNSMGLYVLAYKPGTLINLLADAQLGNKPWKHFRYINIYSQSKSTLSTLTLEQAKSFALSASEQIINGPAVKQTAQGTHEYFLAVPMTHAGKKVQSYLIPPPQAPDADVQTYICENCAFDSWLYLPEESKVAGVPVYSGSRTTNLYHLPNGTYLWTRMQSPLGDAQWGKHDSYNVFAKDRQFLRRLLNNKAEQKKLDQWLSQLTTKIKTYRDQQRQERDTQKISQQRLPEQGLTDANFEQQALSSARTRAKRENWKETITRTYFTGSDWSILRNRLTGIITGRSIAGIIVMQRKDGLCSFHYAQFVQAYDGSNYTTTYLSGLTPGQIKLHCDKT